MANNVFANGREISCKSGSGKSIAAFPDVCMTPPENPATPPGVPVPYPNTGNTTDCTSGSTTVKVTNKEAMLKNKSYFKKSMGDEAGSAAKKGVVTSVNRGKVYFTMWSMDVKIEGENAVRHLDMTTHNHGSAANGPPWPFIDSVEAALGDEDHPCHEEVKNEQEACEGVEDKCDGGDCQKARTCMLVPKGKRDPKAANPSSPNCCPDHQGDHVIEASSFSVTRKGLKLLGCEKYDEYEAPSCCVKGGAYSKDHGFMSALRGEANSRCPVEDLQISGGGTLSGKKATTYKAARENGARSVRAVHTHCSEECAAAQIEKYHGEECKIAEDTKVKAITYGDPMKWIMRLMY